MKLNSFKIRSSLWGTATLAITSILLCTTVGCGRSKIDTDNYSNPIMTTEVSTSCETSTTMTTTTILTTSSTTTSTEMTTTMAETTLTTQPMTESLTTVAVTEPIYIEPETTTEWVESEATKSELPISEYDRILLCNVVASEYGSDWVSVYDKACIVATVMNRVNSPQFPNTIESVLTQPSQFSGYYACNYEWDNVTDSVRESVDYYFSHQDEFGNYLYFWGDGNVNHFN